MKLGFSCDTEVAFAKSMLIRVNLRIKSHEAGAYHRG